MNERHPMPYSFDVMLQQLLNDYSSLTLEKLKAYLSTSLPSATPTDEPLTMDEAAAFLKIKKATLYQYCSESRIPHYKPGKTTLFKRSDLLAWLDEYRVETTSNRTREAEDLFLNANRHKKSPK